MWEGHLYPDATAMTLCLRRRRQPRHLLYATGAATPARRAESDGNKAATEACQADERVAREQPAAQGRPSATVDKHRHVAPHLSAKDIDT
jgi:hypothetical protein